ncbi:MAG: carboxypeptidase-like regulatory domain-containing protein, partial [Candidatus Aenigmatarchaeota archaeon]
QGCTYAANHTCAAHECCADSDCLKSEQCTANACAAVSCTCGAVKDHACIDYECCSNFACGQNEECDTDAHTCLRKTLLLMAPEIMTAGEEVEIRVINHRQEGVEGAQITIEYADGEIETVTTGRNGTAHFTPSRTGQVSITAQAAGYEGADSSAQVSPALGWVPAAILAVVAAGSVAFYVFFMRSRGLPFFKSGGLSLAKSVRGQDVTLRIRNRGREPVINAIIVDSVPAGAFIGCGVQPGMDQSGNETRLTWSASFEPGEEVVITYQASAAFKGFRVISGEKEYAGGGGLLG